MVSENPSTKRKRRRLADGGISMARKKPTKRKRRRLAGLKLPQTVGAFSIPSFCEAHGHMSVAMFFKMQAAGEGPTTMRVGTRTMISAEAAAAWRRKREQATAQAVPKAEAAAQAQA